MTPLRQRIVEDMKVRRYAPNTTYNYVRSVEHLARHYGRSPGLRSASRPGNGSVPA